MKFNIYILLSLFTLATSDCFSQVGIGIANPSNSAILDVTSTTQGVLVPKVTNTQMLNISSAAAGLQVYNTTYNCIYTYNGSNWFSEKRFASKMVDRGDTVTLGNLMVRLPASGNSSAQLAFKSGNITVTGVSLYTNTSITVGSSGTSSFGGYMRQSETFNSTFSYFQSGLNFNTRGNIQQIWFTDETNLKYYKINIVCGPASTAQTTIEIEELN